MKSNYLKDFFFFIVSITLLLVFFYNAINTLTHVFDGGHHGSILLNALDIINNKIPYKEIFLQYGFLNAYINSIFLDLFNHDILSIYISTSLFYFSSILLIGFIVLGPQKMIDAARFLGDLVGQLRGVAKSIPHMDLDEISKICPRDVNGYKKLINFSEKIFNKGFLELSSISFNSFGLMLKQLPALILLRSYLSVYSFVSSFLKSNLLIGSYRSSLFIVLILILLDF